VAFAGCVSPPSGRRARSPADPEMCRLAAENGVDLADWASTTIDAARVDAADVILAMEAAHLVRLNEEFPSSRDRAFLLSCVTEAEEVPLERRDPFGRDESDYERCIGEVTEATRRLAELIRYRM
jgi:protein-tyrosine-phosphatase